MAENEERFMTPLRFSTVELLPGCFSSTFHCQEEGCLMIMEVELIASEVAHPLDPVLSARFMTGRKAEFVVKEYLQMREAPFSFGLVLFQDTYDNIRDSLITGKVEALHAINREYAPFYCKDCIGVYCYKHMQFEEIWDEDYMTGGPDYWKGTCPQGHKQLVDH